MLVSAVDAVLQHDTVSTFIARVSQHDITSAMMTAGILMSECISPTVLWELLDSQWQRQMHQKSSQLACNTVAYDASVQRAHVCTMNALR